MKPHIFLSLIGSFITCCTLAQNTNYTIEGKLINAPEQNKIFLQVLDPNTDQFVSIDSTLSNKDLFYFNSTVNQKALASLTLGENQNIFILEPGNLKAELDYKNSSLSKVTGALDNQQLTEILLNLYTDKVKLENYMDLASKTFEQAVENSDFKVIDSIKTDFETRWNSYIELVKTSVNAQIKKHPNQISSMFLVYLQLQGQSMGQSQAMEFYQGLSQSNKQTNLAQLIKKYLDQQYQQNIIAQGEKMPNFTAQLLQGDSFELQDNSTDVILVHFWASWCEACSHRLSDLREFYDKNKDRNLQIISVSVDLNQQQLQDYIQANSMNWNHALNNQELIDLFGPTTIPTTYVIDKQGVIKSINHISQTDLDTIESYLE
ncbi:redoxin domain-containing protein [Myroides sp. LJL110]